MIPPKIIVTEGPAWETEPEPAIESIASPAEMPDARVISGEGARDFATAAL